MFVPWRTIIIKVKDFAKNQKGDIHMKQATLQLETLTCPSCLQKIESAVKAIDGVDQDSVKVMFNSSKVKVTFDDEKTSLEAIEKAITALGYEVKKAKAKPV